MADLSDDDYEEIASKVVERLDPGRYGDRFVLSRRQVMSLAGGSAGVAGLVALGVDPATAQSAAGQVGTQSSPENVFAYDLDVANSFVDASGTSHGGELADVSDLDSVSSTSTASGYQITINGDTYDLNDQ
jgi:hypothetical protein